MMNKTFVMVGAAALLLGACGEKDQTISSSYKPDEKAWQAASSPYKAAGYQGGDKAAWEAQMRQRVKGQDEYLRVN
jgi:major membrane immunogen (membrane-anchored lipoprotein)